MSETEPLPNATFGDISSNEPDIVETKHLTLRQEQDVRKYQREVMQSERTAKKWTQVQINTFAAIKDAELVAKRFELERIQAEFQNELANKEAEIDAEMREIESECGELRIEIQTLELELSEVKEQRKRDLLAVRAEIATSLRDMEEKEITHRTQIQKLVKIEIQRVSKMIECTRNDMYKFDEV
jgi:predicted nuclease with TOPRIM domain